MTITIIGSIPRDQMTLALLEWRKPTSLDHPFRGKAMVWGLTHNSDNYTLVPEDWLSVSERRHRGFISDNHPDWIDFVTRSKLPCSKT